MLNFYIRKRGADILTVPVGRIIGNILALTMAYQLWGWKGLVFTLGLILGR